MNSRLNDFICEYADAQGIPYGKAERVIMAVLKYIGRSRRVSLSVVLDKLESIPQENFQLILDHVSGA